MLTSRAKKVTGRRLLAVVGSCALAMTAACGGSGGGGGDTSAGDGAEAPEFPTDTVSILVPFAAGGNIDRVARGLAPCLSEAFGGENVIVENPEGGGGAIGTQQMLSSEPDGHTLAILPPQGPLAFLPLVQDVGFTLEDFTPIAETYYAPGLLYTTADSPYETAEEFFEAAKADPNTVSVGTSGAGSVFDLELRHLAEEYDVPVQSVPFNGGAEAHAAVLGGHVDAHFGLADPSRLEGIENGELRALAVGAEEPIKFLPDVPTLVELGYEDLTSSGTSFDLVGPAGIPESTVEELITATEECLTDPEVVEQIGGEDYIPDPLVTGDALMAKLEDTREQLSFLVE